MSNKQRVKGTTYTSTFKQASTKPATSKTNSGAAKTSVPTGRVNKLAREGIMPIERKNTAVKSKVGVAKKNVNPVKIGQETTGALGEVQWEIELEEKRRTRSTSDISSEYSVLSTPGTSYSARSLESNGSLDGTDETAWHDLWIEKLGRGKFTSICDSNGKKVLNIESSSPSSAYLLTYNSSIPSYENLEISAKVHVNDQGLSNFSIIIDYQEQKDKKFSYVSLTIQMSLQTWKLERCTNGKSKTIQSFPDASLATGKYLQIKLQVRNGFSISLNSNGTEIIQKWDLAEAAKGKIGVAVEQSKCLLREWRVSETSAIVNQEDSPVDFRPLPSHIDRALADAIKRDIIMTDLNVKWDDIADLGNAKQLLKEAVILPTILPEFFQGLRKPWKGVLLFGPPGTGKTMIAKALSSQAKTTFFNCSASTIVSKWHGESERLVKTLFQLARHYAPSTIFFDELDALMMTRGSSSEHEASRRLKSEILSQIDGISSSDSNGLVMVLATSNKPWDLDDAMRRRLEKRIYIPLPEKEARMELLRIFLVSIEVAEDVSIEQVAEITDGFSGADMYVVCREASMRPLRRQISNKDPEEILRMKEQNEFNLMVTMEDFVEAVNSIQPSVSLKELSRYTEWMKEFGSV